MSVVLAVLLAWITVGAMIAGVFFRITRASPTEAPIVAMVAIWPYVLLTLVEEYQE